MQQRILLHLATENTPPVSNVQCFFCHNFSVTYHRYFLFFIYLGNISNYGLLMICL